jgi:hypothetical protein
MKAFYVFGTSNLQDMLPVLIEYLEQQEECWVAFFDCFSKKRQLYHYTEKEVSDFFSDLCKKNKLKFPRISFFRINDQKEYEQEYQKISPEVVYVQEINPKYPVWYPEVNYNLSKVVHFAWWDEVKHLTNPRIKPNFSILKQLEDTKYGYDKYPYQYFGNIRLDHLKNLPKRKNSKRVCFIPETYLRTGEKDIGNSNKIILFCDQLIKFLHEKDFKVVWKKREKGFPKEKWESPLSFMKEKPDVIVEKDLRYPSSLCGDAYNADCCIVINDSFAFFDIMHMNTNCIILTTEGGRQKKIDDFFKEDHSDSIIDMKKESGWKELESRLEKTNSFFYDASVAENVSQKIIKYVEDL